MARILWQPQQIDIDQSNMMHFMKYVNDYYGLNLDNYQQLHYWSITQKAYFWQSIWQFMAIIADKTAQQIIKTSSSLQNTQWFLNARLNFAENLLKYRHDKTALIFTNELGQRRCYSYAELYQSVAKLADTFQKMGLKKNDRVAAVLPNLPETVIAMLATTSLGAIWSACSPEFGQESLYDRFQQIQPKLLIGCDGYHYNGKTYNTTNTLTWLQQNIPSITTVVIVNYINRPMIDKATIHYFDQLLTNSSAETVAFASLPFDHPIYIMYSSGTTNVPKCIVHGAGGTLLQHLKELVLHTNLSINDTIFYYTTCGWMMWNWYISSLATGATLVLYDGAAFYPQPLRLIDLIDAENISVFGTSAKYISALDKHELQPKSSHQLHSLRTILSTGSPLAPQSYDYIYQAVKTDVCLSSISGGTDIISCFALGNPILPVYSGELQCVGLGMDIKIFDEQGQAVINQKGELVCIDAFPSMPIYFWNDPSGTLYHQAYFNKYPGVWTHGDFAELTDRGTVIIYGRSDAMLNPGGIRIGTAEIYRQIEKIPEILDSVAVSQEWQNDSRILLFIILKNKQDLTPQLRLKINHLLRQNCSPRHVPAKIIAVPDIPRTLNGKTVEIAVRETIHGRPIKNLAAIANPDSLNYFVTIRALLNQ